MQQVSQKIPQRLPHEHQAMKDCLRALLPLIFPDLGLPPDQHPVTLLENTEKKSLSQAKSGLKMTLGDFVEATLDWHPDKVAEVDAILASENLLTLSDLRKAFSRRYARVIKRGEIKNLEEYYLVKGILDSTAPDAEEAALLIRLVTSFEERVVSESKPVNAWRGSLPRELKD